MNPDLLDETSVLALARAAGIEVAEDLPRLTGALRRYAQTTVKLNRIELESTEADCTFDPRAGW